MIIYFVNKHSKFKGPFDIMDSNREHIIRVGDICLHDNNGGVDFLVVCSTENSWSACKKVGVGENVILSTQENTLLFSFDGIHGREGNIPLIKNLLLCFREKVIIDFFNNAVSILEYKCDYWDISLFERFFAPTQEIIEHTQSADLITKPEENTTSGKQLLSKESINTKTNYLGEDKSYLLSDYSIEEFTKLFNRYSKGDRKALEIIINANRKLVAGIARSYTGKGVEYEDLVQEGMIGLMKAVEKFEPRRKVLFPVYAVWWIRRTITTALIESQSVKIPANQIKLYKKVKKCIEKYEQENEYEPSSYEIEIDESIDPEDIEFLSSLPENLHEITSLSNEWDELPSGMSTDDPLMKESVIYYVNSILSKLKERESYILRHAYGIGIRSASFQEIGEKLGLTRERVRQIVVKTVDKLRDIIVFKKEAKVRHTTKLNDKKKEDNHNHDNILIEEKKKDVQKYYVISEITSDTLLEDLVKLKYIKRKQLKYCKKHKLSTIGDVIKIIEKYHLTPDSQRFTKTTLDMWFSIVSLVSPNDNTSTHFGIEKDGGGENNTSADSLYVDDKEKHVEEETIESYPEVQTKVVSPVIYEFFPVFGITLGKTTWKQAEDMGCEVGLYQNGPGRYANVDHIYFWDRGGTGTFNRLYWTNTDGEFTDLWKSKGFSWENSYNDWINVFQRLDFRIRVTRRPIIEKYHGRKTLCAEFEAYSIDNLLQFKLYFGFGDYGCETTSPKSLYSITVEYFGSAAEEYDDVKKEEPTDFVEVQVEESSTVVDEFFPVFGITLGKTTWKQAEDMGYKVEKVEEGQSRTSKIENVHFWDHDSSGVFTSLCWTKYNGDFTELWKSKGFSWENSYNDWINVFQELGFNITIKQEPIKEKVFNRIFFRAEFEALSLDCRLLFDMLFDNGANGYQEFSPKTLYSVRVKYNSHVTKKKTNKVKSVKSQQVTISDSDINKFNRIFEKTATSYKYFWFLSIMQLHKESMTRIIPLKAILVRMVANAWNYVYIKRGEFTSHDNLPSYVKYINKITGLSESCFIYEVENAIKNHYRYEDLYSLGTPLLKNVPYRFLSPWIQYTNNEDIVAKSNDAEMRCPYGLHDEYIEISELWSTFFLDNYDDITCSIEYELKSHLKLKNNKDDSVYTKTYTSLKMLLNEIEYHRNVNVVESFLKKHSFPLNGKIAPLAILNRIPVSKFQIEYHGRNRVYNLLGGWSLKNLDEIMSNPQK